MKVDNQVRPTMVNRLIQRLSGETRLQAEPVRPVPQNWPTLVFRAPRFDVFYNGCLGALGITMLVAMVGAIAVLFILMEDKQRILGFTVFGVTLLFGPGVMLWIVANNYLRARQAKIVLERDRLVEYQLFSYKRAFAYNQVYEVILRRNKECRIRYYASDEWGQIDHQYIRRAYLGSVRNADKMAQELQRRIAAPLPDSKVYSAFLDRVVGKPAMIHLGSLALLAGGLWLVMRMPVEEGLHFVVGALLFVIWIAVELWQGMPLLLERWRCGGVPDSWVD